MRYFYLPREHVPPSQACHSVKGRGVVWPLLGQDGQTHDIINVYNAESDKPGKEPEIHTLALH
jgi:hypothetical protein